MSVRNRIFTSINIFLLIILLINIVFFSNNKKKVDEPIALLEWDRGMLGVKYARLSLDSIKIILGSPTEMRTRLVGEKPLIEIWNGLHWFQKHPKDTLLFKELYYKQEEFDFYIWFLPDKDSIWRAVDAVKYNPNRVNFSMYSVRYPND